MTEQSTNNPVPEAGNTDSSKASYAAECEERAARERLKALYRKEKEEKEQAQADYERRLNRVYESPEKVGRLERQKMPLRIALRVGAFLWASGLDGATYHKPKAKPEKRGGRKRTYCF